MIGARSLYLLYCSLYDWRYPWYHGSIPDSIPLVLQYTCTYSSTMVRNGTVSLSMSLDLSSPRARSDWGGCLDVPNAARQDRAILTAKNNVQAAEEDGHVVARDADVGSEKAEDPPVRLGNQATEICLFCGPCRRSRTQTASVSIQSTKNTVCAFGRTRRVREVVQGRDHVRCDGPRGRRMLIEPRRQTEGCLMAAFCHDAVANLWGKRRIRLKSCPDYAGGSFTPKVR